MEVIILRSLPGNEEGSKNEFNQKDRKNLKRCEAKCEDEDCRIMGCCDVYVYICGFYRSIYAGEY